MNTPRRLRGLALVSFTLILVGCPGDKPGANNPPKVPVAAPLTGSVKWQASKSGLGFRISDVDGEPDGERAPAAVASPLSDPETARVFGRLPKFEAGAPLAQPFAMRDKSPPAPRAGKTIAAPFPPPVDNGPAPAVASGPLKVLRYAPEGNVDLAPYLSVTFSAPMVPVTSHAELAKIPVPVQLRPVPKGEWRWVGTQTAVFQPDPRFPMATDYAVTIPAGTKAQSGAELAQAASFTFSTPAPKLIGSYPNHGPQRTDVLMYAEFDQAMDPARLLAALRVTAGGTPVSIHAATDAELEADAHAGQVARRAKAGRFLAFKPDAPFPVASRIRVQIPKGTTGTEGPKGTAQDQEFSFQTYDAMRFVRGNCRVTDRCSPLETISMEFNNPIAADKFDRQLVRVSPEIPGMKIEANGNYLAISGKTKGQTTYTVTIGGGLPDTFGQTLGREVQATFMFKSAEPALFAEDHPMIVADPASQGKYAVFSINEPKLRVRVYQVAPTDFAAYQRYRRDWDYDRKATQPPGRLVTDKVISTNGVADELTETGVDLSPALQKGFGHAVVLVDTTRPQRNQWDRDFIRVWVQSTQIGLHAQLDPDGLLGWASQLGTGAPLENVDLELLKGGRGKTDKDGLGRIAGAAGDLLVARLGPDSAFLSNAYGESLSFPSHSSPITRLFVFDDRKMYKPGEEVRLKGWARELGYDKGGDVRLAQLAGKSVRWVAKDPRGAEMAKGDTTLDDNGGFDAKIPLPKNTNTGNAYVSFQIDGSGHHSHSFQVQEFRRPEFEVGVRGSEGPHFVGGSAVMTLEAKYYAGGGLPNADVHWRVNRSSGSFSPPNQSSYVFGKHDYEYNPWSWHRGGYMPSGKTEKPTQETWEGKTNPGGAHRIRLDFDALDPAYPMSLNVNGSVTDVNRQAWNGNTTLLVHPAAVYAGLKAERNFLRAGEPMQLDALAVDLEGRSVAGRSINITSARIEYEQKGDRYEEVERDVETCALVSGDAPTRCTLKTKDGGRHRITAVVTDDSGRRSQTTMSMWVTGGSSPPDRELRGDEAKLVSDKTDYAPGDTAQVLVRSPFAPAEGLLTVRRAGIVHAQRFRMNGNMDTVPVKLDESMLPGVTISVSLAGSRLREDASGKPSERLGSKPAFARGEIQLKIPPLGRTLKVAVSPKDKAIGPGGSTVIGVDVKDNRGQAVSSADMAVYVVDEAVLALSGYKTPSPIETFYPMRDARVAELEGRAQIVLARLRQEEGGENSPKEASNVRVSDGFAAGAAAKPQAAPMPAASASMRELKKSEAPGAPPPPPPPPGTPIAVRTDFSALALFSARVTTDARGHADVPVKLPDNLTRYRVMTVAASRENMFGAGEAQITARLPLMLRPSAPRFLNFGDRFELPVVLQNQTDAPMEVNVVARALNASIDGPAGRKVKVPANDRVEVRLPSAAQKPGIARFQIGAESGTFADASQIELPVWTPATTEAFATYGVLDQGATAQRVKMPDGVVTQFGGLEITTSSTALQALTDAVLYLVRYPYECNEQVASRVIAIAALKDVLGAFKAEGLPPPAELTATVQKDLDRLRVRQHPSGGWGFWFTEPWPYLSVHVTHTLVRAKEKGFAVDPQMLARAMSHIKNIESYIPAYYGPEARRSIIAYALYVRKRMGEPDAAKARALLREGGGADKTSLETIGWLMPTLSDDKGSQAEIAQIRRHLQNRVTETAGAAHFATSYGDGDYLLLHSDHRADGILLESIIGDEPKSDLIPKLVTGLLGHRKAGRWGSTQENAFVLLALDRYFAKYEGTTPDFVAKVWLGDRYAGEQAYKGRSTDRHEIQVPMQLLAEVKDANLVVSKDGPGRLYYRVGMQYAPEDLRPPPMDRGFVVSRRYEAVDNETDVRADKDGTVHVKAGAKVRVRVTMVAPARRHHVALVDPMPAGFEAMNPALAVTGPIPQDTKDPAGNGGRYWWSRTWYEHQNMRDERVEAFASLLWDGVHEYVYVARATTPGTFVVPPPKAEEMYSPEVFGRGAGDKVVVE
jgi:hypothetical protein